MSSQDIQRAIAILIAGTLARPLAAQLARADSLLDAGALQRAESSYYAAVQTRPHDPTARWALGRYLVWRGAPRVGMTLFEEALQFGGNAVTVGADLAPVYLSLGEFHKLSALRTAPLSNSERERARWLVAHSTKLTAPDSATAVPYSAPTHAGALGTVILRINGHPVEAIVTAHERGIIVSDTSPVSKRLRTFRTPGAAPATLPAVADSIGLGRLSLAEYPVDIRVLGDKQQALIGIDVLARFAPTFDPVAQRLTLRTSGTIARPTTPADELPTLLTSNDLRVLRAGGWMSVGHPEIARMLTTRRWTFDARRGQLTIER